ncbi:MAG: hypothetical protein JW763_07965 [candidate division Zixibacteria bacterium]|nr:hypothetical protein [candidate division Zixibacteria bacterium]
MRKSAGKTFDLTPLLILFFALTVLLRLIPLLMPEIRLWGMNHLLFLPDIWVMLFTLVWIAAVAMSFGKWGKTIGVTLADRFNTLFYEKTRRLILRAAVTVILTLLIIVFASPMHFLGDGYDLLKTLGSEMRSIIKPSEMGASYVILGLQSILGGVSKENALTAFQIVSVTSGAISVWLFFLLAGVVTEHPIKRVLIFTSAVGSGALLLFFGYVETYPLLWPTTLGYLYFGLRFIKTGHGPAWPLPFLLAGMLIHVQSTVLLPSYFYMILSRERGLAIYRKHARLIWSGVITVALVVLTLILYKYYTDLFVKDAFLPLITGKPIDPGYAIISAVHFLDICNELVLISPLILPFGLMALFSLRQYAKNNQAVFLAIAAAGYLLFLLVVDPKLAMPRDWDLFAMSGFTLTLTCLTLISEHQLDRIGRFVGPFVIFLVTAPIPFLITNLGTQSSIQYAEYIMNTDVPRSMSTLVVLHDYYEQIEDHADFDRLTQLYRTRYTNKINIDRAFRAAKGSDLQGAKLLLSMIEPDEYNVNYHKLIGYLAIKEGRADSAIKSIDRALQLKPYIYDLHKTRALAFLQKNIYDSALVSLRRAYTLKADDIDLIQAMSSVYFNCKEYDSMGVYAFKCYAMDTSNYHAGYLLSEYYYIRQQPDSMHYYVNIYRANCSADPYHEDRLHAFDSLLKELPQ